MSIVGPIGDWRGYSRPEVDVFVNGSTSIPLTTSVRLDHAPMRHVHREFECAPGPGHLSLPLTDLFDRDVARVNEMVGDDFRHRRGLCSAVGL